MELPEGVKDAYRKHPALVVGGGVAVLGVFVLLGRNKKPATAPVSVPGIPLGQQPEPPAPIVLPPTPPLPAPVPPRPGPLPGGEPDPIIGPPVPPLPPHPGGCPPGYHRDLLRGCVPDGPPPNPEPGPGPVPHPNPHPNPYVPGWWYVAAIHRCVNTPSPPGTEVWPDEHSCMVGRGGRGGGGGDYKVCPEGYHYVPGRGCVPERPPGRSPSYLLAQRRSLAALRHVGGPPPPRPPGGGGGGDAYASRRREAYQYAAIAERMRIF